jgi:hypothetical protein
MMMRRHVGIEPRPVARRPHFLDDPMRFQRAQVAVHRVQRDGRYAPAHPPVDVLGIWMVFRPGQLRVNLAALVGGLDARSGAGFNKPRGAAGLLVCTQRHAGRVPYHHRPRQ